MNELLRYTSVTRWLNNFPDRPNTRRSYLLMLKKFVDWTDLDPDTLIVKARKNQSYIHSRMKEYYNMLIGEGKSLKTAILAYQSLRSFFRWNDIVLGRTPRSFKGRVEYESTHVLTPEEIAKMVDVCSTIRDKCLIVFLAQSGQRSGILTALKLRHVKHGLDKDESPLIIEVPAILRDKKGLNVNKLGEAYRFAVGKDTIKCLRKMVEERMENGEPLDDDSWLFRSYSKTKIVKGRKVLVRMSKMEKGKPITSTTIREIVDEAASKAKIQAKASEKRYEIHPHIFRRYWNMRMQEAGLSEDLRNFMLGHKLPYDGAYSKWYPDAIKREWNLKNVEKFLGIPAKTIELL